VSLPGMVARKRPAVKRPEKIIPVDAKDPSTEEAAKKLSLAQKMGLVPMPPAKLSHDDWQKVASKSINREDSCRECPICMDTFRAETQVILSCSHVFHQACLASFERFSGRATCPLCRSADYEKRLFEEGRKNWERLCAGKLQAVWRGHCGRKIWNHLLDTVVPTDPVKRRDFFARRMGKLSSKLLSALDDNDDELEVLFRESEQALSVSRQVFNPYPTQPASRPAQTGDAAPETSTAERWAALRLDLDGHSSASSTAVAHAESADDDCVEWGRVEEVALARDEQDCAICLGDLGGPEKQKALTSCSHLFHAVCLASFERFASAVSADRHGPQVEHVRHKCPCCRSGYTKRLY
jgi:hypothetical protein